MNGKKQILIDEDIVKEIKDACKSEFKQNPDLNGTLKIVFHILEDTRSYMYYRYSGNNYNTAYQTIVQETINAVGIKIREHFMLDKSRFQ